MPDFRCFEPGLNQDNTEITLSPFESHHLIATNRAREGDAVILFNGQGLEWQAEVEEADRRRCRLKLKQAIDRQKPETEITLAVAITKGKTFDTILRQATELGVTCIQPLITDRTLVRVKDSLSKKKKWEQQLIEACKQCGNPWLPTLKDAASLNEVFKTAHFSFAVVASLEEGAQTWKNLNLRGKAALFVGPEGDFSPHEYKLLQDHGVIPVSLGPYVLRSETAAVSALAQLSTILRKS